ncbi:excalibur calcium-binding domain-containing protein [Nocardia thailandica]|uniref:Excalibur calcium-binding domain-containing protein n=1 Tax=Nocardia thailandica TaxID=257275 RepID=A0ABW6PHE0_9NOCA
MNRPTQPPDPWARPPRPQDRKRRWPVVAGVSAAGVLGLGLVAGIGAGGSEREAAPAATSRAVATSTTTRPTTTTAPPSASTTTAADIATAAPIIVPTTTVAPPVPTTTVAPPPVVVPPVVTTTVPAPVPAPRIADVPAPEAPSVPSVYYKNCAAAKAAGAAPLRRGDPGYRSGLDGDGDGVACER